MMNDRSLYERGYKPGQKTGGMGFLAGDHSFVATNEGFEPVSETMSIEAGKSSTVIVMSSIIRDEDGEVAEKRLLAKVLRNEGKTDDYLITMFNLSERPSVSIRLGSKSYRMNSGERVKIDGAAEGSFEVAHDDQVLDQFYMEEPGNYVLMIFDEPDGSVNASFFIDHAFEVVAIGEEEDTGQDGVKGADREDVVTE
ncbi:MAG: hypothetical protein AAGD22_04225 [Verrucomicrobiota bacterium]